MRKKFIKYFRTRNLEASYSDHEKSDQGEVLSRFGTGSFLLRPTQKKLNSKAEEEIKH